MKKILITGGAGFIGSNAASRFLAQGAAVTVFDDLSRRGTDKNLRWLKSLGGDLTFIKGDIRDAKAVNRLLNGTSAPRFDLCLHLAAQVAVTTSVVEPREDFEINALGTFNLLEAVRAAAHKPVVIYSSTNKVYGKMEYAGVKESAKRYSYAKLPKGVTERMWLDFYSPYGCSKGAADQYVIDYARIYGLKTITFRQSCIYGPRQFGVEDQGWVAHFIICAVKGRPITIYGDGKQVRDILYVDDLVDAFLSAARNLKVSAGNVYNIGGGMANSVSLLEFIALLEKYLGRKIELKYGDWRPGDQKVYISSIDRARKELGWTPKIGCKKGIELLVKWVQENKGLFDGF
ncbi:MAG: SDR family NAD(P)-dependent oxidoreductase [Candidatus Omnitrophota bacterium]